MTGDGTPLGETGTFSLNSSCFKIKKSASSAGVNLSASVFFPAAEIPGINAVSVDPMTKINKGFLPFTLHFLLSF